MYESTGDFQEPCPRCAETLADSTAVEQDEGMLFYRVWFTYPACGYWLCTRRLSVVYQQEGRLKEARAAYAKARTWAPELFPAQGR